jgi:hypothetical protein
VVDGTQPANRVPMRSASERTRVARHAEIVAARGRGENYKVTCSRLGISRSYYYDALNDPDGSHVRARRERYRQPCPMCGELKDGSWGNSPRAPTHCAKCAPIAATIWTRESILDAIKDFNDQYGRPPGAQHWNPAYCRTRGWNHISDQFYVDGCWPAASTVQERFGTWNAAIALAGFTTLESGHHREAAA